MERDYNQMIGTILLLFGLVDFIRHSYLTGLVWVCLGTALLAANLRLENTVLTRRISHASLYSAILGYLAMLVAGIIVK